MNRHVTLITCFICVMLIFSLGAEYVAASDIPNLVQYTGLLADSSGNPLANGRYSVVFKLYDDPTEGPALWEEAWDGNDGTHPRVATQNGRFTVLLGNNTVGGLDPSVFSENKVTYLGITVGNDNEMRPRQRISSVPYAMTTADSIPRGGIIMWSGSIANIPNGWALCNGEDLNSDGEPDTPDLRNRFIVGAGEDPGNDYVVGASGGSITKDVSHMHTGPTHTHSVSSHAHPISHNHYVTRVNNGSTWSESGHGLEHGGDFAGITMSGSQSTTTSGSAGGGQTGPSGNANTESGGNPAQDIMPPYYALAFIMKL